MAKEHCWHPEQGEAFGLASYRTSWGEACCWCGARRTVTDSQEIDPTHGPHARAWRIVRKAEGGEGPCPAGEKPKGATQGRGAGNDG
jgi:hypothetical protein